MPNTGDTFNPKCHCYIGKKNTINNVLYNKSDSIQSEKYRIHEIDEEHTVTWVLYYTDKVITPY